MLTSLFARNVLDLFTLYVLYGKTILILLWLTDLTDNTDFFAACFSHTEMTKFTDTVSIACSPRYLPATCS